MQSGHCSCETRKDKIILREWHYNFNYLFLGYFMVRVPHWEENAIIWVLICILNSVRGL